MSTAQASLKEKIAAQLLDASENLKRLADAQADTIEKAARAIAESIKGGGKLVAFGNGGSAADAQHLTAEFSGRFEKERPGLAAVALTVNPSAVTAIANDYGYDRVFSRQVENFVKPGDVVVAISTSGNSASVIEGARQSKKEGAVVIGWTGESGGKLKDAVDICIRVPSTRTSRIQEGHLATLHTLCALVDDILFPHIPGK